MKDESSDLDADMENSDSGNEFTSNKRGSMIKS